MVEASIDSVVITSWPQVAWFATHGFDILLGIVSAAIGFASAYLIFLRQRRHAREDNRRTTYHLLVGLCNEMKRNLDRTWYFIKCAERGPFPNSVLVDDTKESCLQEFVERTEDQSVLKFILPFYDNLRLINIHQVNAIEGLAHAPADSWQMAPTGDFVIMKPIGPVHAFRMARNFAIDKYRDMCDQYGKAWERLCDLAKKVEQKVPDDLKPIGEQDLEDHKRRIDALLSQSQQDSK